MAKRLIRSIAKRAGQKLKGGTKSATRLNEEGKRVRMSKDTSAGVMREVGSKAGAKQQNTPAARKIRKAESKAAADVKQPAMGTPGATAEAADANIRPSQVAANQANKFDKALKEKENQLAKYEEEVAKLSGTAKLKYINKNKQRITTLRNSIKDMKSRGGPGGRSKVRGKKIPKAGGGKTIPQGSKGKGVRALVASGPKGKQAAKDMGFAVAKKGGRIVAAMKGGQIVSMMYDD